MNGAGHSLLWAVPEERVRVDRKMLSDLSLDEAVRYCHKREKETRYFLSILASPPQRAENSLYRAGLLQSFRNAPSFYEKVLVSLTFFDSLEDNFQMERTQFRTSAGAASDVKFVNEQGLLITTASTLKSAFDTLHELLETLDAQEELSTSFDALKERLHEIFDHESYPKMDALLDRLIRLPDTYLMDLQFTLDDFGRMVEYDILDIQDLQLKEVESWFSRLFKQRRSKTLPEYELPQGLAVTANFNEMRNLVLGGTFGKLSEMLTKIFQSLCAEFSGMSKEMIYYRVAINLIRCIERTSIPLLYPAFTEDGDTDIESLYDFILVAMDTPPEQIIPNDVHFGAQASGILIRGENSSGKTVYLRSIATALLFAQGGLPILAKKAVVRPFTDLYTLFASAEKDFSVGSLAGRFEEEVRTFSALIDEIEENSLLFLNEVFQTTSYAEGAVGLYHILNYLSQKGVRWIAVTHLLDLFTLFEGSGVTMLETENLQSAQKYKLKPIDPKPKK